MARLLIVDDDEAVLAVMAEALRNAEFDVESAVNGPQALEQIRQNQFDLLITDILMPEIDGLAIIDKAIASNQDISVLAISGGGPDQDGGDLLEAAMLSGADAILEKPFLPDELIRTARALLR
ncbi:response regulator transcription factor [Terasakiella sp.]|uniref:response regulator transcription factor n=1 Tax=Terasakiella sp. TaxID=2034861 RepID=UPI003AA97C4D